MPVAKTYQNYPLSTKPYIKNNKQYVKILMKNGSSKEVRWYSDIEYERLYPGEEKIVRISTLKKVLGFDKGYIIIFKGDTYNVLEWFQNSVARYHRLFGWYIVSTEEVPNPLPFGIEPIQLIWEDIAVDDNNLKTDKEVIEHINNLRYEPSTSEFVGNIKDKVAFKAKMIKVVPVESYYGTSHLHIMEDVETKNIFVWNTSTTALDVGATYHVAGTVKEHKQYKNIKQTVLTRCKVVEV